MTQNRYYSSTTRMTTLAADPGSSGTSLQVADSTVFSSLDGLFPWTVLIDWGGLSQEICNVTARPDSTHLTVVRGQDGTLGVAHSTGVSVTHGVSARDFNEAGAHVGGSSAVHGITGAVVGTTDVQTLTNKTFGDSPVALAPYLYNDGTGVFQAAPANSTPQIWSGYGHSYLQYVSGTTFTTGRFDSQFRQAMGLNYSQWRNFAINGSRCIGNGVNSGGWATVVQNLTHYQISGQNIHGTPYWADNGAYLFCWGINDLGATTNSTQAQIRAAYQHSMRAIITRARSSVVWEDDYTPVSGTVGQASYGAGFTLNTGVAPDSASGDSVHQATTTTNATVTLTLPADYAGQVVFLGFVSSAGATGGTATFSGTAGVTGTFSTSNVIPTGSGVAAVAMVKRITNLTSANAGQTIVITVTSLDAGGAFYFDYWGLEASYPNPVVWCNCPRLPAAGYTGNGYPNTFGDADVTALNSAMATVVAEFDGMVQLADLDSAINKNTLYFASDNLHPNEIGAGILANVCYNTIRRFVSTSASWPGINATNSAPQASAVRWGRVKNDYYTANSSNVVMGQTFAVGNMYAIPFLITEAREIYGRFGLVQTTAGSTTSSARLGVYADPNFLGYPQYLFTEATSSATWTLTTAAGLKEYTSIYYPIDPGLWWLAIKFTVAGTGQTFEGMLGPDEFGAMPRLGSTYGAGTMTVNETPIAWLATGQGTGTFPTTFPTGASVTGVAPRLGLYKL